MSLGIDAYIEPSEPETVWLEDHFSEHPRRRRLDRVRGAPLAFYEDRARTLIKSLLKGRRPQ